MSWDEETTRKIQESWLNHGIRNPSLSWINIENYFLGTRGFKKNTLEEMCSYEWGKKVTVSKLEPMNQSSHFLVAQENMENAYSK